MPGRLSEAASEDVSSKEGSSPTESLSSNHHKAPMSMANTSRTSTAIIPQPSLSLSVSSIRPSTSSSATSTSASKLAARAYRAATNSFVTRRIGDALAALRPILNADHIRSCSRNSKAKIWGLYFAILDEAAKMTTEEARGAFDDDLRLWRNTVARVRSGEIWEEVISVEGGLDELDNIETATALAGVLFKYAPPLFVQSRVEDYLSSAAFMASPHKEDRIIANETLAFNNPNVQPSPAIINQKFIFLEMYLLHVLPANNEFDYARDYIAAVEDIDQERKDNWLATLDQIQDQRRSATAKRALDHAEAETRRKEAERKEQDQNTAHAKNPEMNGKTGSERPRPSGDYGLPSTSEGLASPAPASTKAASNSSSTRGATKKPKIGKKTILEKKGAQKKAVLSKKSHAGRSSSPPAATMGQSIAAMLERVQDGLMHTKGSSAYLVIRAIFILIAIILMIRGTLARTSARGGIMGTGVDGHRVKQMLWQGWGKLRQTVGMGFKTSYI